MYVTVSIPDTLVNRFKQGLYEITRVVPDLKSVNEVIKHYLNLNIEHGINIKYTQANIEYHLQILADTGELERMMGL